MTKKEELQQTLSEAVSKVTQDNDSWKAFLNTASNLYRYKFDEQLLIYQQRPNATGCAEINSWNILACRVKKGAKGIALFDEQKRTWSGLKYVFDVSDVYPVQGKGRLPVYWKMKDEYADVIQKQLEDTYGEIAEPKGLIQQIRSIADERAKELCEEFVTEEYLENGKFETNVWDTDAKTRIWATLADSIAYMTLRRCGISEEELKNEIYFPFIDEFKNNRSLLYMGNFMANESSAILVQIRNIINEYEKQQQVEKENKKVLDKSTLLYDNTLKCESDILQQEISNQQQINNDGNAEERGNDYERNRIRINGGLLDSKVTVDTRTRDRTEQIWQNEKEISGGVQTSRLQSNADNEQSVRTFGESTGTSRTENRIINRTDGESLWSDRRTEGQGPDEVGGDDEQHQTLSRRNSISGIDLCLSNEKENIEATDVGEPQNPISVAFSLCHKETPCYAGGRKFFRYKKVLLCYNKRGLPNHSKK